jgi:hypothetical protein
MAVNSKPSEATHAIEAQLGGKERRKPLTSTPYARKHLPLIADLHGFEPTLEPPPRTRGECPDVGQRPCPFVRCRHHLWREDEPPGRPGLASVPRDANGCTLRVLGDYAQGQGSRARLDASAWVRTTPRPSCALHVADQVARSADAMENTELADAMGKHRTLTLILLKRAVRKFKQAGGTLEGLEALRRQEQEKHHGS